MASRRSDAHPHSQDLYPSQRYHGPMVDLPVAARPDLAAFGLLFLALVGLHMLRTRDREDASLTRVYRAGLWLVLWHGTGLLLRLGGLA